jgi:beta-lactamase regulating signal transducer with metallopeptidase domain/protocatechuate 3,4-dioxygenase beta subunit
MIGQINNIAEIWWAWMWPMFWQVGVLVALIWLVDLVIRAKVWPQVRYALWLLVLVKLVLPPTFSLSTSVTSQLRPLVEETIKQQEDIRKIAPVSYMSENSTAIEPSFDRTVEPIVVPKESKSDDAVEVSTITTAVDLTKVAQGEKLSWRVYVMGAWLVGAVILTVLLLARFRQLRQAHRGRKGRADVPDWLSELLADTAKRLNLRRTPEVALSRKVTSPAVFGVFKPVLLLPEENITGFSQKDFEHVLLHELAHLKRGDLWVHSIYMVLQIIYWFNPLLWFVRRQLQHLRELCCDATVAGILRERTVDYRETVVETARRLLDKPIGPGMGLLGLFEDSNRLLVRLKWLEKKTWRHRVLRIVTIFTVVAIMFACILPMAKAKHVATASEADEETDVKVNVEPDRKAAESKVTSAKVTEPSGHAGRMSGIVVSSVTGEPVSGAYVGVGDFGDSGGSNYSRHRSQGFHDKTETDEKGRFQLGGLVFTDEHPYLKNHPLVVTHPDFVRHDEKVKLLKDEPVPDIKISLRPAARINVVVVDSEGKAVQGSWLLRLEALDGRWFIPPGQDRHLSSFASSVWLKQPDLRKNMGTSEGFSFTELDTGEYSIEAIRLHLRDKPTERNVWAPLITYHGAVAKLKIEAGQTKEVQIKPANHQTSVEIEIPEDPYDKREFPPFIWITRKLGLLLDTTKVYHPEDERLGRVSKNAYFYGSVSPGGVFTIKNLPAGSYSVFTVFYGKVPTKAVFKIEKPPEDIRSDLIGPAIYVSKAKVEVSQGRETTVKLPPINIDGVGFVKTWTLGRSVKLEARQYSVKELCELLTAKTESNPRFIADSSIEDTKLRMGEGEMSIWDVLEKLSLDKGWRVDEGREKTLILRPGDKTGAEVKVEKGQDSPNLAQLLEELKNGGPRGREAAAQELGELRAPRAVDALIAALKDTDVGVRGAAARALGNIGDERAVEPLIGAYQDKEYESFIDAIWALGDIGGTRAEEILVQALNYQGYHPHVRNIAAKCLTKLGWEPANREQKIRYLIALEKWEQAIKSGPSASLKPAGTNQAEGPFELNIPIVIPLEADKQIPAIIKCPWLQFSTAQGKLKAALDIQYSSWPHTKWVMKIDVLDVGGTVLGQAKSIHSNSGIIEKYILVENAEILFGFDRGLELTDAARFRFSIESFWTSRGNPIQFNKELPLSLELNSAEQSRTIRAQWLKFQKSGDRVEGTIHLDYLSWPKAKWEVGVYLLDKNGTQLTGHTAIIENGGIIIGQPVMTMKDFRFSLEMWGDVSRAVRYGVTMQRMLDSTAKTSVDLTLSRDREGSVSGTVKFHGTDAPAAGVVVRTISKWFDTLQARTDQQGSYTLAGIRPEAVFHVSAEDERKELFMIDMPAAVLKPGEAKTGVDLTLYQGREGSISGKVVGRRIFYRKPERFGRNVTHKDFERAEDAPLPGVKIILERIRDGSPQETLSDETGHYRFEGLRAADYIVRAELPQGAAFDRDNYPSLSRYFKLESESKTGVDLHFRLDGISLAGRVTDAKGSFIKGAKVAAEFCFQGDVEGTTVIKRSGFPVSTVSGEDGRYQLANLSPVTFSDASIYLAHGRLLRWYELRVQADGYAPAHIKVPPFTENFVNETSRLMEDHEGMFRKQDSLFAKVDLPKSRGDAITGIDFVMEESAVIMGRVLDTQGNILAGPGQKALVRMVPVDSRDDKNEKLLVQMPDRTGFDWIVLDEAGRFKFDGIHPGSYFFEIKTRIDPPDTQRARNETLVVEAGEVIRDIEVIVPKAVSEGQKVVGTWEMVELTGSEKTTAAIMILRPDGTYFLEAGSPQGQTVAKAGTYTVKDGRIHMSDPQWDSVTIEDDRAVLIADSTTVTFKKIGPPEKKPEIKPSCVGAWRVHDQSVVFVIDRSGSVKAYGSHVPQEAKSLITGKYTMMVTGDYMEVWQMKKTDGDSSVHLKLGRIKIAPKVVGSWRATDVPDELGVDLTGVFLDLRQDATFVLQNKGRDTGKPIKGVYMMTDSDRIQLLSGEKELPIIRFARYDNGKVRLAIGNGAVVLAKQVDKPLNLEQGGKLQVYVTLNGKGQMAWVVSARPVGEGPDAEISTQTGKDGRYELTGLKEAEYLVSAPVPLGTGVRGRATVQINNRARVKVEPGKESRLDFEMRDNAGIRGAFTCPDKDLSWRILVFNDSAAVRDDSVSEVKQAHALVWKLEQGQYYEITCLPPGTYRVVGRCCKKDQGWTPVMEKSKTVTLKAGKTTEVDFAFP